MGSTGDGWAATFSWPSKVNGPEPLNRATMVGRFCPQAGAAGTKAERGHSCPQQRRTEAELSNGQTPLSIWELLRTRMSALRSRHKNLRGLSRISYIVIQRAGP